MPAYGGDTMSGNLFFLDSQLGVGPWATVGEYPIEEVSDASPFIGSWILWIYICFAQVVMLNLLIAMMNRRVDRYYTGMEKGSGDRYFLQLNIARQLPYLEALHSTPPPFSLLSMPRLLCVALCGSGDDDDDGDGDTSWMERQRGRRRITVAPRRVPAL